MKRIALFVLVVMAVSIGAAAQDSSDPIATALLAAPANCATERQLSSGIPTSHTKR
jgi:hypothetical protein